MSLKSKIKSKILSAAPILFDLRAAWLLLTYRSQNALSCPCCGFSGRFRAYGMPPRLNAACPRCRSMERHRLQRLYLDANPDLALGKEVLHFAPENASRSYLAARASRYVACDYEPRGGDLKINIESIDLADASFDLIVCSHVLEHVDDRKALPEMRRILRPGGTALLMTPVVEGWAATYENPAISAPEDRIVHFGQRDHLRMYGADIRDRIRSAGFSIEEYTAEEPNVGRHGLSRGEKIFVCS